MAFILTRSQETSQKIRVALSMFAWDVIDHDGAEFGSGHGRISFINDVLENYIPDAQASVSRVLAREECGVEECLRGNQNAESIRKKLIDRKKHELLRQVSEDSESGAEKESYVVRLRTKVIDMLKSAECQEEKYYDGKIASYINAVLEEYARLSYKDREEVCHADKIRNIRQAIRDENLLEVRVASGTTYIVIPHSIQCDPMASTNYLVGFSQEYSEFKINPDEMKPSCFRISNLKTVNLQTSRTARLTHEQTKYLREKMVKRGVEFLSFEDEEIVVRLTVAGQQKYRSLRHLRPKHKHVDGNIYTFNCTVNQAEFYFFKFGGDAEILKPEGLRKRFANMYQVAHDVYNT